MQAKLIGIQLIDFQNKEGNQVRGTKCFIAHKDENVSGLRTAEVFIKEEIKFPECKLNDTLDFSFNMKGKVEAVSKVQ